MPVNDPSWNVITSISTAIYAFFTIVLAGAAIAAGCYAKRNLDKYNDQISREMFSSLLTELSSQEASIDRGVVTLIGEEIKKGIQSLPGEEKVHDEQRLNILKSYIMDYRDQFDENYKSEYIDFSKLHTFTKSKEYIYYKPGACMERTIARLDRVGFFIFAEKSSPKTIPPDWLWTIVYNNWVILGKWVDFRQDKARSGPLFHYAYGKYFKKMNEYINQNENIKNNLT